jgi:hypothetical protein
MNSVFDEMDGQPEVIRVEQAEAILNFKGEA